MIKASTTIVAALLLAAGAHAPGVAAAQPAGAAPTPPPIIGLPGLRPSGCLVPEPRAGRLRTYPIPSANGLYAAYGSRDLLPTRIDVSLGERPQRDDIGQLLFGAQTILVLPSAARLLDHPTPVTSLGVPRRPMAELYFPDIAYDDARRTTAYGFKLTASVWEIAGRRAGRTRPVICLYFVRQPH